MNLSYYRITPAALITILLLFVGISPAHQSPIYQFTRDKDSAVTATSSSISPDTDLVSLAGDDQLILVTMDNRDTQKLKHFSNYTILMKGKLKTVIQMAKFDALRFSQIATGVSLETDRVTTSSTTQNSPDWGLDRIDQRKSNLDSRYSYGASGKGVTVYVVDSGVRSSISDLAGRVQAGWYFPKQSPSPDDCDGHGTSVASLIAGTKYGVAKSAKIVPFRVFDCNGKGLASYSISALSKIIEVHPGGPAVINMSLGADYSRSYNAAVENAVAAGFTVVVSAGNDGTDSCSQSPASASSAITVGSTTRNDSISSFSNVGRCVDIFAPGSSLASSDMNSNKVIGSGTSYSTALVSGLAARLLEEDPSASPQEIARQIISAGTPGILSGAENSNSPNLLLFAEPNTIRGFAIPEILGVMRVGKELTGNVGQWETGVSLKMQWQRDGDPIAGATKDKYVILPDDLGTLITLTVTGTRNTDSREVTSLNTTRVETGTFESIPKPVLSGVATVGQELTVKVSATPNETSKLIQWFVDGAKIEGSIGERFMVSQEHVGKRLAAEVTLSADGYAPYTFFSEPTSPVEPGQLIPIGKSSVTGEMRAGSTLRLLPGKWADGVTTSVRWLLNGAEAQAGESLSFEIPVTAIGQRLSYIIEASKPGYKTFISPASSEQLVQPMSLGRVPTPAIVGVAKVGKVLRASVGNWGDDKDITYQWKRNGKNISDANLSTYTLTQKDLGATISVQIKASKLNYASIVATSKLTKKVTK